MINIFRAHGFTNTMIHITGESDTGKTLFALQSGAAPSEIAFIDADVKGRVTVEQIKRQGMEFGFYRDVVGNTKGMREVQYYEYCMGLIEEIESLSPEHRRAIVWDTWEPFEKTLKPVVQRDPKRFREFYSPMGQIKGAEEWLASFDYEAEIVNRIVGMCELFLCVTHVKNYNIGGKRVEGKVIADCKRPVVQKSLVRIWLKHNPVSAVPIGLVMKRLGKTGYVEGKGIRTVNVLPRKITPREGDESLWDTVKHYWENPIGNRLPLPHETPDEFELSILESTLTEDQRMVLRIALQDEKESEEFDLAVASEQAEKAKAVYEETGSYAAVKEALGVTLPEAIKLVKGD